jgi:hypothetical protein
MKRPVIGTLLLAFALLVGVSALCRATKSKPFGMVVRGDFVTEAENGRRAKSGAGEKRAVRNVVRWPDFIRSQQS